MRKSLGTALGALAAAILLLGPAPARAATARAGPHAFATGSLIHADALQFGTQRLVDTEVAFSAASTAALGRTDLLSDARLSEVGSSIHPALTGKTAHARASSLELGVAGADGGDNQLILAGKAEDAAPGSSPMTVALGPYHVQPLFYLELLHASAIAYDGDCVLGTDASRGQGFAADVELGDTGVARPDGRLRKPLVAAELTDPDRVAVSSLSRTRFVAQTNMAGRVLGSNAGLMSEVRETFAPIKLLTGTQAEINIEIMGEWVLRAVATGEPGGAWIHYGPADVSPETRVIRVTVGGTDVASLTAQQFLSNEGRQIVVPGVAEIGIGEPPRAIGGAYKSGATAASNGTLASAAVDVVRVKLAPSSGASDVRVGHMEVLAHVPVGGIACPLPVKKSASKPTVPIGDSFDTKIAVTNPYDCALTDLRLADGISVTGDATFDVANGDGTSFSGGGTAASGRWLLGNLARGATVLRNPGFTASGGPGTIDDVAVATARCSILAADGQTAVGIALTGQGSATLGSAAANKASVGVTRASVLGLRLVATGVGLVPRVFAVGLALLMAGALLAYRDRQRTAISIGDMQ